VAASRNSHSEVVERLIAAGAKVDAVDKVVPTPLPPPIPTTHPLLLQGLGQALRHGSAASLAQPQLHRQ
jgi:hypothetical protein